jgi:putative pyruvate formate lyase activating enzyme
MMHPAPSYLKLHHDGTLRKRVRTALKLLQHCELCPRRCGVDRRSGETGYCRTGRNARVASFSPHFGEESPLVGRCGSGTIFLSSCNLLCTFCQNFEISHHREGQEVAPEHLAVMMLKLATQGCHNINFVTPGHVVPQILEGLSIAIDHGLEVPLVYNSSGYDTVETLHLLEGIFDIYMPDFKFWDTEWSERYCNAPDYREQAITAIKEMHRQVGDLKIDARGIAERGLLVRHLVMPNGVAGTAAIMNFLAREISPHTYVNVMNQYRPCGHAVRDSIINRGVSEQEYKDAVAAARHAGLKRLDPRKRFFRLV